MSWRIFIQGLILENTLSSLDYANIVFNDTTWASELRIVNGQGQAVRLNGVDVTCSSAFWKDVHMLVEETNS